MNTTKKPRVELSVVFPAYNDAGTIPSMVIAARLAARKLADDYEIVVVNDGSADHTADVLAELEAVFPELRVVHHPENRGYGGALRTGFDSATKDLIFYTDGDAQYDPREMERLFEVCLQIFGCEIRGAAAFSAGTQTLSRGRSFSQIR